MLYVFFFCSEILCIKDEHKLLSVRSNPNNLQHMGLSLLPSFLWLYSQSLLDQLWHQLAWTLLEDWKWLFDKTVILTKDVVYFKRLIVSPPPPLFCIKNYNCINSDKLTLCVTKKMCQNISNDRKTHDKLSTMW